MWLPSRPRLASRTPFASPAEARGANFRLPMAGRCLRRLLLLALLIAGVSPAAGQQVFVAIASPDVPVSEVSSEELRDIFLLNKRFWERGRPITVLLSEPSLESGSFLLDQIYRMDYSTLRRWILEKLYRGEIDLAPKVVATEDRAIRFVATGQGLIALVPLSALGEDKVRILAVDGQLPSSDTYPLRR